MPRSSKTIEHPAQVVSTNKEGVTVCMQRHTACDNCHAKSICGTSDGSDGYITVNNTGDHYAVGDRVKVIIKQSTGYSALFIGYVLPFLLVLLVLIVSTAIGMHEAKAGLLSLAILAPYYLGVYLLRGRISKRFTFHIQRL